MDEIIYKVISHVNTLTKPIIDYRIKRLNLNEKHADDLKYTTTAQILYNALFLEMANRVNNIDDSHKQRDLYEFFCELILSDLAQYEPGIMMIKMKKMAEMIPHEMPDETEQATVH